MNVRLVEPDGLRVLLFFEFDHRAAQAEVVAFQQRLIACEYVQNSVELSGSFDFFIEVLMPDLKTYNAHLKAEADDIARLVARYEACFVCQRFTRENEPHHCLWIPSRDGLRRIECSGITKIVAEGDYMRIYCGRQSWLHHVTMSALLDQLDAKQFLHLHRSVAVNVDFVERVIHQGVRWVARLRDGTTQPISRTHVPTVMKQLRTDSATPHVNSANAR